jgi:hypothetical protein
METCEFPRCKLWCPIILPANGPIAIEFLLPQRLGGRKITPNGPGIWGISV